MKTPDLVTRCAAICLLALLLTAAAAQERSGAARHVGCGDAWVTFALPAVSQDERRASAGLPMVNAPKETVLSIRKRDVRNLVWFPDTRTGEVVFSLQVVHPERDKVIYSALVTEAVYLAVLACLQGPVTP